MLVKKVSSLLSFILYHQGIRMKGKLHFWPIKFQTSNSEMITEGAKRKKKSVLTSKQITVVAHPLWAWSQSQIPQLREMAPHRVCLHGLRPPVRECFISRDPKHWLLVESAPSLLYIFQSFQIFIIQFREILQTSTQKRNCSLS